MISDPDKGYITSGPYQLSKQYVIDQVRISSTNSTTDE